MEERKFYIIKVLEDSDVERIIESKNCYEARKSEVDKELLKDAAENFDVVFLFFEKDDNDIFKPTRAFIAEGVHISDDISFTFKKIKETNSKLIIENFCKSISLDLKNSYDDFSYVLEETAPELLSEFKLNIYENNVVKNEVLTDFHALTYDVLEDEDAPLGDLVGRLNQNDEYAIRMYKNATDDKRDAYERDRDRIIHCKACRRLVDKAQIFTSAKGDHYRTRMTHTLEVTQIARSIARQLHLNESLCEAISLAHDLGHTPFGHQGERTLEDILNGKIPIILDLSKDEKQIEECLGIEAQGFKHNFQVLRVLTMLEHKYAKIPGMNISYQVMEGAWKHTRIHEKESKELLYNIDDFFKYEHKELLYPAQQFASTLEGQVVAIADEIAQRSHDLDDAFKSQKINASELKKYTSIRNAKGILEMIQNIEKEIETLKDEYYIFVDEHDMFRARLCSGIIDYFIRDVIEASMKKMKDYDRDEDFAQQHIFSEKLITFSLHGAQVSDLLENVVTKKVINSAEVAQFDATAANIVKQLFEYYYEHPLTMSSGTLVHLYQEIKQVSQNVIDFRNSDIKLISDEIYKITKKPLKEMDAEERCEYALKRRILCRNIADNIGGMTDTFAIHEYQKLFATLK